MAPIRTFAGRVAEAMAAAAGNTTTAADTSNTSAAVYSSQPYPAALIVATFSLPVILLILPPLSWHLRNRNIGAAMLVLWTLVINFLSFINALIWPNDDIVTWYNGAGLCDIEVKLQMGWSVAAPAGLACVLRGLAKAMDTKRVSLGKTQKEMRIEYAIDVAWCIGFPMLQMLFHYIVQYRRYYLFGISGCIPAVSKTWLTVPMIFVQPLIWTVIDAYFAGKFKRASLSCPTPLTITHSPHPRAPLPLPHGLLSNLGQP
jgi:pheromone a factor receptor